MFASLLFAPGSAAAKPATAEVPVTGIEQLTHVESLPILRPEIQVHYVGSMDKRGGNADWDWWLSQDAKTKEWVIMDAQGPGCLWNFVVHCAVGMSDPVYRFYFDGSATPGFEIKHSEFGTKPPFIAPLAGKFQPSALKDERLKRIDFQIVRSFCPMPFTKSLKITSSVKLAGNEQTGGGWGHAIWHSYPTAEGIHTFTGREDYAKLIDLWSHCGQDPKPVRGNEEVGFSETIPGKSARTVFSREGAGSLPAIRLQVEPATQAVLGQLWIRLTWDAESTPAVECPIGAFFGNEFGGHRTQTLMQGTKEDGTMYCYWPMPFWRSAKIELENRSLPEVPLKVSGSVAFLPASALAYPEARSAHFRSSAYQPMVAKNPESDSPVASLEGSGHVVAGLISARKSNCEGDVRVHIDGGGTPAVQSDGSESWACYGWGFEFPPQANPASSYDGKGNGEWSMLRLLTGDFYPFRSSLRITVEGGSGKRGGTDVRSGLIFWYGEPRPAMALTDSLDLGNAESEKQHEYIAPKSNVSILTSAFEGEHDDVQIAGTVRTLEGPSEFNLKIDPGNQGVILRRRSDQSLHGQRASVSVDGKMIQEHDWHYADGNPNFRWLEDEFFIPASYTKGRRRIHIRIDPTSDDGKANWNESFYQAFSLGVAKP